MALYVAVAALTHLPQLMNSHGMKRACAADHQTGHEKRIKHPRTMEGSTNVSIAEQLVGLSRQDTMTETNVSAVDSCQQISLQWCSASEATTTETRCSHEDVETEDTASSSDSKHPSDGSQLQPVGGAVACPAAVEGT